MRDADSFGLASAAGVVAEAGAGTKTRKLIARIPGEALNTVVKHIAVVVVVQDAGVELRDAVGGISITIGSHQQTTDAQSEQTTAVASTVGATSGNVTITAGNRYNQIGSNVLAMSATVPADENAEVTVDATSSAQSTSEGDQGATVGTGNITITAQQVNIVEANNTAQNVQDTSLRLPVSLTTPATMP